MNKKCNSCQSEKDISEFGTRQRKMRDSSIKIYLSIYCKECVKLNMKLLRRRNPEISKNDNNGLKAQRRKAKWLEDNLDKRKEYEKQYYLDNIDQFKKNSQAPKCKESKRIYKKNRRHTDPIFKLRENVSNAIFKALKKGKSNKAGKSILQYLGYTIQDLKIYLENQFDDKMSWNNHGIYWHIDHIIPQSDLPYISMEDDNFKKCWALENLRPYSSKQNFFDGVQKTRH